MGCLRPVRLYDRYFLLSMNPKIAVTNYIVAFRDPSPDGILLPNENEVIEFLSLQRTALKLTSRTLSLEFFSSGTSLFLFFESLVQIRV